MMKTQKDGSVTLSQAEWEKWDHLTAEMMNMMDKVRGKFITSNNIDEIESFLDK